MKEVCLLALSCGAVLSDYVPSSASEMREPVVNLIKVVLCGGFANFLRAYECASTVLACKEGVEATWDIKDDVSGKLHDMRFGALMAAAGRAGYIDEGEYYEIARFLLRNGVLPAIEKNGERVSALWPAVESGALCMVDLLRDYGIGFNLGCDGKGGLALHKAVARNDGEMAIRLLRYGARPDKRDSLGGTAITLSLRAGQAEMAKRLCQGIRSKKKRRRWRLMIDELSEKGGVGKRVCRRIACWVLRRVFSDMRPIRRSQVCDEHVNSR